MLNEYYLRHYGAEEQSSEQSKQLRKIILTDRPEPETIEDFKQFVLSQNELYPDTASLIIHAIMAHYGSEYMGLGGSDALLKANLFKEFIDKFPNVPGFKFYYADASLLANKHVNEIYPVLKEGMLQDKENVHYPSAELFDMIHESEFSFEFDMLLLEKYYFHRSKDDFDSGIAELKEQYTSKEQHAYLDNLTFTHPPHQ